MWRHSKSRFPAGNMHVEVTVFTHIVIRFPKDNYLLLNRYTYFIYIIDASFTGKKKGSKLTIVC
jgi:hypothetical protein